MPTFGFEIKIRVAGDSVMNCDAQSLALSVPNANSHFILKPAVEGRLIRNSRDLIIEGQGFESREEANRVAEYLKSSLFITTTPR